MATEYGKRLRQSRKHAELTQLELSAATGIPQSTISTAEREGHGSPFTSTYARACNVDPHWLATGEGSMLALNSEGPEPIDLDNHPDLVRVRTIKMRVQAGVTGFTVDAEQSDGPPIYFRADWMRDRGYKPYNLVAFKVRGDSMAPTLFNEDTAVANTADVEPKDGKVFAVNYEGEAVVKRMFRDGGSWWLSSDNPDQRRFPRKECAEGSCIIIGRVIHRQSEEI